MPTLSERAEWISKIDELTAGLNQGHLFGGSFTTDNQKVVEAAKNAKALLIDYSDSEQLFDSQRNTLSQVMGDLRSAVESYTEAKKTQKNPYSLEGDEANGIAKATGSKKVRLESAKDLSELANDCITALNRPLLDPNRTTTTTVNTMDLEGLKDRNHQKDEAKATRIRLREAHNSFVKSREDHKQEKTTGWASKILAEDFANIGDLHRDELLSYSSDKDFLKKYEENRIKIDKTVSAYKDVTKLQKKAAKGGPEGDKAKNALTSFKFFTGLTDKKIASAKEKVDTLEMIGRHMDAKLQLITNREFSKLNDKEKTALNKLSVADIDKKLGEAESIADEDKKASTKNMYSALKKIKELEGIGVTQVSEKNLSGSAAVHDQTKKIGRGSVRFQVLGASFKGPNLKPGVSGKVNKDGLTLADASIPVEGKVRVAKFSTKFQTKNKLFSAGFRVNGITAKASASVGATLSASDPFNAKIYASAGAEAHGLRAVGKVKFGNKKASVFGRADGSIGHASASGSVGVGAITIEDPETKEKKTAFGLEAGGSLKAEVFSGKVSGGCSIFGIKFSGALKGSALSAGVEGEAKLTTGGLKFGLGAALGLGAGFEVSIDWSGLTKKFTDWRKRKAVSKQAADKLKAEKNARKEAKKKIANRAKKKTNPVLGEKKKTSPVL